MIRQGVGNRVISIPPGWLTVATPRSAAAVAIPWYLSGGISAANCIAAYQPKGAADLATSYVNLANPGTYNCSVFPTKTEPTFNTATGWTFNGAGNGLTTGVIPNQNYSWIVRYSDAVVDNGFIFGVDDGTAVRFHFYPKYTDNNQYFRASGTYSMAAPADFASGVAACTKDAAYWNGTSLGSVTGDYSGSTSTAVAIGINPISSSIYCPGVIQAIAFYDRILTSDEVAALSTAIAAL